MADLLPHVRQVTLLVKIEEHLGISATPVGIVSTGFILLGFTVGA